MFVDWKEKAMNQNEWVEHLRKHYAIASVGGSTLMHQSGKGRNFRTQQYLINNLSFEDIASLDKTGFQTFLDNKTTELSRELPKPDNGRPNWGAARKVLNIFLRQCAMNKDINSFFELNRIEGYLEVPLDNHIVEKIDENADTSFAPNFKIRDLTKKVSDEIQKKASDIATEKEVNRYELDVLFWNHMKLAE